MAEEPEEIDVTPEMAAAGADVLEQYSSGEPDPIFVAAEVFRAMRPLEGHQTE